MFSLKIDDKGDKLNIIYGDHFDKKQAEQFYAELERLAPKINKGAVVIADMSALEKMDLEASVIIEKVMDLLSARAISKVIRIVPDESRDIGLSIIGFFHYSHGVIMHTFKSQQEADKYLERRGG